MYEGPKSKAAPMFEAGSMGQFETTNVIIAPVQVGISNISEVGAAFVIPTKIIDLVATGNTMVKNTSNGEWGLAALVGAVVKPGAEGGNGSNQFATKENALVATATLPISVFAKLGIKGLKDNKQVSLYLAVWQYAIKSGLAKTVKMGDAVVVPNVPFADVKAKMLVDPTSTFSPKKDEKEADAAGDAKKGNFVYKLGHLDKLTVDDVPSAVLLVAELQAWIDAQKLVGNMDVENEATKKPNGPFAQEPCSECGTPASMITATSKAPAGLPAGAGWMSAETGHKDGCTKALPSVH